jgi:hypothetical protein
LGTLTLIAHPDHPPARVSAVEAAVIGLTDHWLSVRWRVEDAAAVLVPEFAGKNRADGLWQQTCFELFLRQPGEAGYVELNLSPSEQWAAYDFAAYRAGVEERPMPRDPVCTLRRGRNLLIFDAAIPRAGLPSLPWQIGVTAVIAEADGVKSYWALRHGDGAPDFHAPACFAATLGAPAAS